MARRIVSSDKRFKPIAQQIDLGTAERRQHGTVVLERRTADRAIVARAATSCMLDSLQQAGQVTEAMHRAGVRLRRDYLRARIEPRTIMNYTPVAGRGSRGSQAGWSAAERSETEELAYKDWRIALQIVGVGLSDALVSVCCLDLAPLPRHRRALVEGLEALIKHYRLT